MSDTAAELAEAQEALRGPTGVVEGDGAPEGGSAPEGATEAPLRSFSPDARTVEQATRTALVNVRAELAELRAERDGPLAERIRQLVADEERLRRCVVVFDRERVTT